MSIMHETKLITVLLTITLLSGITLASTKASADVEVIDQVSLTVPIACTMTGEGTSHTATLDPGTYSGASGSEYENGIGKTTLTAICNDDNGFSIYAIGYTGNSYDSENHTKLVGSTTGGTIATKAYTSGDTTSNWSMKLTKITDSAESYNPQNLTIQSDTEGTFSNWHSVPDTYTKVAEYHANTGSSTTDTTLGVKLETTYAAYISSSQPADTYVGQVKYTMVHPYTEEPLQPQSSASGKICYYANASSAEGTMGCQNVASSVTLLASNFSRTGYGFAGWSDKFDYATNSEAKFYGPQETMTIPDTSIYNGEGKGLSLYAVWVKSQGSIQDSTKVSEVCNRLTTDPTDDTANLSSVSALTDQRDNNTYAIAKLADGKCWMIENLRLENTGTDNTNGSLAQGYNSSFIGLADPETPWANNSTAANSLYTTEPDIQGKNTISGSDQGYRFPRYNNTNTSARAEYESGQNVTTQNARIYSYGNYYTWSAAIADTTAYTSNNTSVTNTSICPSGWHLPKGGDKSNEANNEFWSLVVTGINNGTNPANYESSTTPYYTGTPEGIEASNKLRAYPNNFVYSGNVYGGSVYNRGSDGWFWSSTALSSDSAYYLYLYSSIVRPGTYYHSKYYGRSVRCVAPGV